MQVTRNIHSCRETSDRHLCLLEGHAHPVMIGRLTAEQQRQSRKRYMLLTNEVWVDKALQRTVRGPDILGCRAKFEVQELEKIAWGCHVQRIRKVWSHLRSQRSTILFKDASTLLTVITLTLPWVYSKKCCRHKHGRSITSRKYSRSMSLSMSENVSAVWATWPDLGITFVRF